MPGYILLNWCYYTHLLYNTFSVVDVVRIALTLVVPRTSASVQILPFITGTPPTNSSIIMTSTLTRHFSLGGGYPVGGASQIALNIIPVIEDAGGSVLVRAKG